MIGILSRLLGTKTAPARTHRQARRQPLSLLVLCRADDNEFLAEVLDIAQTGIRVRMKEHVSAGCILAVRCTEDDSPHQTIHMGVAWCAPKKGTMEAGLQFVSSRGKLERSWLGHLLRRQHLVGDAAKERRRHARVPTRVSTRAYFPGNDDTVCGMILDLSDGGARLEAPFDSFAGAAVALEIGPLGKLPAFDCAGQVVDSRPSLHGATWVWRIRFDSPPARLWPYLKVARAS